MHSGLDAETEAPPRASEEPLHVLICGWKTRQFMCALCRELDRGRTQLPRGSHVTFFNEHPPETLDSVEDTVRLHNVTATHVHGSALARRDVQKLDVTRCASRGLLPLCMPAPTPGAAPRSPRPQPTRPLRAQPAVPRAAGR